MSFVRFADIFVDVLGSRRDLKSIFERWGHVNVFLSCTLRADWQTEKTCGSCIDCQSLKAAKMKSTNSSWHEHKFIQWKSFARRLFSVADTWSTPSFLSLSLFTLLVLRARRFSRKKNFFHEYEITLLFFKFNQYRAYGSRSWCTHTCPLTGSVVDIRFPCIVDNGRWPSRCNGNQCGCDFELTSEFGQNKMQQWQPYSIWLALWRCR